MNETYEIELKPRQLAFLKEMAEKHGLADESKAVRCLIDYAIEKAGEQESIFSEIRCLDC